MNALANGRRNTSPINPPTALKKPNLFRNQAAVSNCAQDPELRKAWSKTPAIPGACCAIVVAILSITIGSHLLIAWTGCVTAQMASVTLWLYAFQKRVIAPVSFIPWSQLLNLFTRSVRTLTTFNPSSLLDPKTILSVRPSALASAHQALKCSTPLPMKSLTFCCDVVPFIQEAVVRSQAADNFSTHGSDALTTRENTTKR